MGCEFLLHVKGVQKYRGQEPDTIELTTEAELTGSEGVLYLRYAESELTGLEGTRTSVMVMPDQVVVDRDGILGALTGPLTAASGGIAAAVLFGSLAALVFPSREK